MKPNKDCCIEGLLITNIEHTALRTFVNNIPAFKPNQECDEFINVLHTGQVHIYWGGGGKCGLGLPLTTHLLLAHGLGKRGCTSSPQ